MYTGYRKGTGFVLITKGRLTLGFSMLANTFTMFKAKSQAMSPIKSARFAQTVKQPNALQADLTRLSHHITQPSPQTKSCLANIVEWFALASVWELAESFIQFLLHGLLQPLFENAGDLLTGIFN
jgi:hypothetical protein